MSRSKTVIVWHLAKLISIPKATTVKLDDRGWWTVTSENGSKFRYASHLVSSIEELVTEQPDVRTDAE